MVIVYLYSALTTFGGADRVVTEKANYLADKLHHSVYIITDSQCGIKPVFPVSPNVKHIDLDNNFDEQYKYNLLRRFFCYRRLLKSYKEKLINLFKDIKPDIVISTCGRELEVLKYINRDIVKIGESHIARPFVRNFHLLEQKSFIHCIVAKFWRKKQEKDIKQLDAFVVLTQHDATSWANVKEAHIIPNSLPFTPKTHSECNTKKIISVGRLDEQKGYERLIDAWAIIANKYPEWQINIYGEGILYKQLSNKIIEKNLGKSIILHKPTKNIVEEYIGSSIYVMSSRFEGFGMVLIEAMICGLPCISFNCPYGPSDIIQNGENGFLVENGNIEKLASAIEELIQNEPLRKQMGKQAHISVQKYSPDVIMKQWDDLFHNLKANKKA